MSAVTRGVLAVLLTLAVTAPVYAGDVTLTESGAGNLSNNTIQNNDNTSTAAATGGAATGGTGGSVNVEGDTTYSYTQGDITPTVGADGVNFGTPFGGIGLTGTEEYRQAQAKIEVTIALYKAGILTDQEAKRNAYLAYQQMDDASCPKRLLMLGPKTRGRHLLNGFGMLATDSWKGCE